MKNKILITILILIMSGCKSVKNNIDDIPLIKTESTELTKFTILKSTNDSLILNVDATKKRWEVRKENRKEIKKYKIDAKKEVKLNKVNKKADVKITKSDNNKDIKNNKVNKKADIKIIKSDNNKDIKIKRIENRRNYWWLFILIGMIIPYTIKFIFKISKKGFKRL